MPDKNNSRAVIVALGSNMGDSAENIVLALAEIRKLAAGGLKVSALWRSEAKDMTDGSGDFINACVSFGTKLEAAELLKALQRVEVSLGRPDNHGGNVERTIDLDIIDYDSEQLDLPNLIVPHPRMLERLFVLLPLEQVRPEYQCPISGRGIAELIASAPQMVISQQ